MPSLAMQSGDLMELNFEGLEMQKPKNTKGQSSKSRLE